MLWSGVGIGLLQQGRDRSRQVRRIDGLRRVRVAAGLDAAILVARESVCGERDDRTAIPRGAQLSRGVVAVQSGICMSMRITSNGLPSSRAVSARSTAACPSSTMSTLAPERSSTCRITR